MNLVEIFIIALALSIDAAAVTMANCASHRGGVVPLMLNPALFGFFQAFMTALGYFLMKLTGFNLGSYSKLLVFLILTFIGLRTLYSFFKPDKAKASCKILSPSLLLTQGVCTSVDAFAFGVSLSPLVAHIFIPSLIVGSVTAVVCYSSLFLGTKIRVVLGEKGLVFAGVLLIAVGVKALF